MINDDLRAKIVDQLCDNYEEQEADDEGHIDGLEAHLCARELLDLENEDDADYTESDLEQLVNEAGFDTWARLKATDRGRVDDFTLESPGLRYC